MLIKRYLFGFLRSISLNKNISDKPFEGITIDEKKDILRVYYDEHVALSNYGTHWPDYNSATSNLKIQTLEGFVPKYNSLPSWIFYNKYFGGYLDYMVYPIFHNDQDLKESFQSILINYIVNNYTDVFKMYKTEIITSIQKAHYDNLVLKSFLETTKIMINMHCHLSCLTQALLIF